MDINHNLSNVIIVADHLEEKTISLLDALGELGLDAQLAENDIFCTALDFLILCCSDCGYWKFPCMKTTKARMSMKFANLLKNRLKN